MLTKDEIISKLKVNVCEVTFTKVNGDTRIMKCTLQAELLPVVEKVTENKTERKPNPDVVSAWSIDANGWRSFRVDSVTAIKEESNIEQTK